MAQHFSSANLFVERKGHTQPSAQRIGHLLQNGAHQYVAFIPLEVCRNGYPTHALDFNMNTEEGRNHKLVVLFMLAQHYRMQHGCRHHQDNFIRRPLPNTNSASHMRSWEEEYGDEDDITTIPGTRPGSVLILEKVVIEGKHLGWMWYLYTNYQGQPDSMGADGTVQEEEEVEELADPPMAMDSGDDIAAVEPIGRPDRKGKKKKAKVIVATPGEWVVELATRSKSSDSWMNGLLGGYKGRVTASVHVPGSLRREGIQKVWQEAFHDLVSDPTSVYSAFHLVAGVDPGHSAYIPGLAQKESNHSIQRLLSLENAADKIVQYVPLPPVSFTDEEGAEHAEQAIQGQRKAIRDAIIQSRLWACEGLDDPVYVPASVSNTYYYSSASICNPHTISRTRMPDFEDNLEHLSPAFIQIMIDNPHYTTEMAIRDYRARCGRLKNVIVLRPSVTVMDLMETYRTHVPTKITMRSLKPMLEAFARTAHFVMAESSNLAQDCNGSKYSWLRDELKVTGGVTHLFAVRGASGELHMDNLPSYTSEQQLMQYMFRDMTCVKVVKSVHALCIWLAIIVWDAVRDNNLLSSVVLMEGPAGAGKSMAMEYATEMAIPNTCENVSYSTEKAGTDPKCGWGYTQVHDECLPQMFGVPKDTVVTILLMTKAVMGALGNSNVSLAESLFKTRVTTREMVTQTCYVDNGRRFTVHEKGLKKGSEGFAMNTPGLLASGPVKDRCFMTQSFNCSNEYEHEQMIDNHSKSALTASMKEKSVSSLWKKPFQNVFRGTQALLTILFMMMRGRVIPETDMSALDASYIVRARMLELFGCDVGTIRTFMKVSAISNTITAAGAINTVFGKGIGAPDPAIPFDYSHLAYVAPFLMVRPSTGDYVMQLMHMGTTPTQNRILHVLRKYAFGLPDTVPFPAFGQPLDPKCKFTVHHSGYAILTGFAPLAEAQAHLYPRMRNRPPSQYEIISVLVKYLTDWFIQGGRVSGNLMDIASVILVLLTSNARAPPKPGKGLNQRNNSEDVNIRAIKLGTKTEQFGDLTPYNLTMDCLCVYIPIMDSAPRGGPAEDVFSAKFPPRPAIGDWAEGVSGDPALDEFSVFPPEERAHPDAPIDLLHPFGKRPKFETHHLRARPNPERTAQLYTPLTDEARKSIVDRSKEDIHSQLNSEYTGLTDQINFTRETLAGLKSGKRTGTRVGPDIDAAIEKLTEKFKSFKSARKEVNRALDEIHNQEDIITKKLFTIEDHSVISQDVLKACLEMGTISDDEYATGLNRCKEQSGKVFVHRCLYHDLALERLVQLLGISRKEALCHVAYPSNQQRVLDNYAHCTRQATRYLIEIAGNAPRTEQEIPPTAAVFYADFLFFAVCHFVLLGGYVGGMPESTPGRVSNTRVGQLLGVMNMNVVEAGDSICTFYSRYHSYRKKDKSHSECIELLRGWCRNTVNLPAAN